MRNTVPQRYSIYGFEVPVQTKNTNGYHSFLGLVQEATQESDEPKIIQELHFKPDLRKENWPITARLYTDPRHDIYSTKTFAYISGQHETIYPIWNRGLKAAQILQTCEEPFIPTQNPDAQNCRAATIAILDAMGLAYVPAGGLKRKFGTKANLFARLIGPNGIPYAPIEELDQMPPNPINEVHAEHDRLVAELT